MIQNLVKVTVVNCYRFNLEINSDEEFNEDAIIEDLYNYITELRTNNKRKYNKILSMLKHSYKSISG